MRMSSNEHHFPIISTTPPPFAEDIDDDDDEFGTFSASFDPDAEIDVNTICCKEKTECEPYSDLKTNDDVDNKNRNEDNIFSHVVGIEVHLNKNNLNVVQSIDSPDGEKIEANIVEEEEGCDNISSHFNYNDDDSFKSIEFPDPHLCQDEAEESPHDDHLFSNESNDNELSDNREDEQFVDYKDSNDSNSDANIPQCLPPLNPLDPDESEETNEYHNNNNNSVGNNDFSEINVDANLSDDFADFSSFQFPDTQENREPYPYSENRVQEETESVSVEVDSNKVNNYSDSNDIKDEGFRNEFSDDDDFADFAAAPLALQNDVTSSKENESEFADFTSFTTQSDCKLNQTLIQDSKLTSNRTEKIDLLISQTFPSTESDVDDLHENNISIDLFSNTDSNSMNLWKSVQNLEDAPSLKLRWSQSHSFQTLLAALKIDPRNILRNSSVPIFASGLGNILEPTKHTCDHNEVRVDNNNENEEPSLTSIPPAQFDWSSSGLTNPLDLNQKSTAFYDLDFFITSDDVKNSSHQTQQTEASSLEQELLKEYPNSKSGPPLNNTNLVKQLLSNIKSTSASTDANQTLSAEALQVLDELPNLSFMRAKVLMFPIRSDAMLY